MRKKVKRMKIAFTGSHGTGKTTLQKAVTKVYPGKIHIIEEVARKIIEKGFPLGKDGNRDSYINFVNDYTIAEMKAEKSRFDLLISDRTIFDAIVYSQVNVKLPRPEIPKYLIDMMKNVWLRNKDFYDLYIYFPIEFPMEADGVRPEDEQYRLDVGNHAKKLLDKFKVHYITVAGTVEQRLNTLKDGINEFQL